MGRTTHLNRGTSRGDTACGRNVTTKDEAIGFYSAARKPTELRSKPLTVTDVFDEVTCALCFRSYEYTKEKTRRARISLKARQTRTYLLKASVTIKAADELDAERQLSHLFSREIRDRVVVTEVVSDDPH